PNGAGKTTLIDALTGFVPGCGGAAALDGRGLGELPPHERFRLGLARTFQSLELFEDLSVAEDLAIPVPASAGGDRADARGLREFGLAAAAGLLPSALTHGERASVGLGRALAARPKVLMLDEPAAGLDPAGRTALAGRLRRIA